MLPFFLLFTFNLVLIYLSVVKVYVSTSIFTVLRQLPQANIPLGIII